MADAINSDGVVVGGAQPSGIDPNHYPCIYTVGGSATKIFAGIGAGIAYGINDNAYGAEIVGTAVVGTTTQAFLATQSGGVYSATALGLLSGGTASYALAINNAGYAVGWGNTSTANYHALIYTGSGVVQDLNSTSLVTNLDGWTLNEATAISNGAGYICGYGTIGGYTHGFLLTPTPEPSTLLLAATGLLGLLAYAWRRRK